MRAGKLTWGALNTNACPAGSFVITDAAECQVAAGTAGMPWVGDPLRDPFIPRGCIGEPSREGGGGGNVVYLNTHPTGNNNPVFQPLCTVGAAGVRAVCVRACVRACVRIIVRACTRACDRLRVFVRRRVFV